MIAYEGKEPFVFISYAHKDKELVLPIIQGLQDRGFRVWYDQGIEVGREWPEYIAQCVKKSDCVLAFVSSNFDLSNNCRREINYAIDKRKTIMVIYLEDKEKLSEGMQMQLGVLHAMYLNRYSDHMGLVEDLIGEKLLKSCCDPAKFLDQDARKIFEQAESQYDRNHYGMAVKQYYRAAMLGYAPAQYKLGHCYDRGKGVPMAKEEAVRWYRMAAEQGDTDALYALGVCFEVGNGVRYDFEEMLKWYRLAAEEGDMDAQYCLGFCYDSGQGVSQNMEEAAKWYRLAAEQGHISAQYFLGMLYEEGEGVQRNKAEARKWYQMAADQGDEEAFEKLNAL